MNFSHSLLILNLIHALTPEKNKWDFVCELENSRGRKQVAFMHHYYKHSPKSSSSIVRSNEPIIFQLVGTRGSWWQLPLSILNGTRIMVRISRQWSRRHPNIDAYLDAVYAPMTPNCEHAIARARRKIEFFLRMPDTIISVNKSHKNTTKTKTKKTTERPRQLLTKIKKNNKHKNKKYGSRAPKFPPPEAVWDRIAPRVTIRAIVCDSNGTKLASVTSKAAVVPSLSSKQTTRCAREDPSIEPKLPPPSSSYILDAILNKSPEARELAANATQVLASNLIRRGVLCDEERPCRAELLRTCPICDTTRFKADATPSDCLFAAAMASVIESSSEHNIQNLPPLCAQICVNEKARDQIWLADVSKGKDARDQQATACRVIHLHGLAAWYYSRSNVQPFAAKDNLNLIVKKGLLNVTLREWLGSAAVKYLPTSAPIATKSLRRCAVVGSGHTLRCGSQWGPVIDSRGGFDAVFRVNKVQFAPWTRSDYLCRSGVRTDFVVNAFGGENDKNEDGLTLPARFTVRALGALGGAAIAKSPLDFLHQNLAVKRYKASRLSRCSDYRDYMAYDNFIAFSPQRRGDYVKSNCIRKFNDRYPKSEWPSIYVPSKLAASRVLGSGSGSTALAIALTMCHSVDLFGFGVFKGKKNFDFRYLHYYQEKPYFSQKQGGGAQVFNSEIRNHIYDAFGIANYIWY